MYQIPNGTLETNLSEPQRYPWNQLIGFPTVPLKPIYRIPNGNLETNLSDSQRQA